MDERRRDDVRIDALGGAVSALQGRITTLEGEMKRNTEVTEDVRDILGSFRVLGNAAKWTASLAAAGAAIVAAWRAWKGG